MAALCEVPMQSLLSDLRYAARELHKRPGFTLTAVLSLALGIGATSAVFSVIYAVLIDPFPYPGAERMVEMRLVDKAGHDRFAGPSGTQADQLRQAKSLEDVTLMDWWPPGRSWSLQCLSLRRQLPLQPRQSVLGSP